jgi:Zn-dependent peptidase ImmA (M78 family)
MRRGFKTEAEGIATETRSELGLLPIDALDPWELARHLAIPVVGISTLIAASPEAANHLLTKDSAAFSAVTVFRGSSRVIWHNDGHSAGRQSSNVTHEISHALLMHMPARALDDLGLRNWDRDLEDEANWLAGALLIPSAAALAIARAGLGVDEAARRYGVSQQMARWRLNVTGAFLRASRTGKTRSRSAQAGPVIRQ